VVLKKHYGTEQYSTLQDRTIHGRDQYQVDSIRKPLLGLGMESQKY